MYVRGHTISTSGGAFAIICFFLPWVSQSCGNEPPRVRSGWELLTDGDRLVLLVPLTALVALVVGLVAWRRGYASRQESITSIGLGMLGLLFLLWKFGGRPPEGISRDVLYGLWGVVAANVAIVLGGLLSFFAPSSRTGDDTTAGPDDETADRDPTSARA